MTIQRTIIGIPLPMGKEVDQIVHTNQLIQTDLVIKPDLEAEDMKGGAHPISLENHIPANQETLERKLGRRQSSETQKNRYR